MEGFKEFQGKDLDSAIEEACGYFNTAREKLEIEILQDAKSGIFGIVGARKAKVRARRAHLREAVESILGKKGGAPACDEEENTARASAPDATTGQSRQAQPKNGRERSHERGRKSVAAAVDAAARSCTPARGCARDENSPDGTAAGNSCGTAEAADLSAPPPWEESRSGGRRESGRVPGRGRARR